MGEGERQPLLSVAEYLMTEERSKVRHEYIGGRVYAMADSTAAHGTIVVNILVALRQRLRSGSPSKVFVNDMKVQLHVADETLFYYPDVVVTCHAIGAKDHFTRFPTVIFEVLSDSTESTDRREKLTIQRRSDTLDEYVLVDQNRREVTLHRRSEGWVSLLLTKADAVLELSSLGTSLPLAEICEGVDVLPAHGRGSAGVLAVFIGPLRLGLQSGLGAVAQRVMEESRGAQRRRSYPLVLSLQLMHDYVPDRRFV